MAIGIPLRHGLVAVAPALMSSSEHAAGLVVLVSAAMKLASRPRSWVNLFGLIYLFFLMMAG